MRYARPALFLILFCCLTNLVRSQKHAQDSFRLVLKNAKHDTLRAFTYVCIGEAFYLSDPDSALIFWEKARLLCEKNLTADLKPMFKKAFRNHLATALQNSGLVYQDRGKIPEALDVFFKALKLKEELGVTEGIANANLSIGGVYAQLGNKAKALGYYEKAIQQFEKIGDKSGVAATYNNIGVLYHEINDTANAILYFEKTLKIEEEIQDLAGMAYALGAIGTIYQKNDPVKAMGYFTKSLKMHEEVENKFGMTYALNNLGTSLCAQKKFAEAEKVYKRALELSREINYPENIETSARELYGLYKKQKNGMKALEMHELYIAMRDTVGTQEARKAAIQKHIQYEYDKKAVADSLIHAEKTIQEEIKHNEAIKQQRIYTYSGIIGFVLMLIIAGVSFRAFKNKQKANEIISQQKTLVEGQKHMIEEKQKEIIDSIMYARRIQRSLLANEKYIDKTIERLNKKA